MGLFLIAINFGAAGFNLWAWLQYHSALNLICVFVSTAIGLYLLTLESRR